MILAVLVLAVAAVYGWDLLRPPSSPAATPAGGPGVTAPAATRPPSSDGAGAAVPGVEQATLQPEAAAPAGTAAPEPGSRILALAPKAGSAGWWTGSEARGNHLGDSYLYAGHFDGQPFISAIIFDLAGVPRGAPINEAALRLTGLQADRFDAGAGGTWTVQLLAAESFKDLADGPARADFQQIYSAPAAVTLLPTLFPADLGQNEANVLTLDASGRAVAGAAGRERRAVRDRPDRGPDRRERFPVCLGQRRRAGHRRRGADTDVEPGRGAAHAAPAAHRSGQRGDLHPDTGQRIDGRRASPDGHRGGDGDRNADAT